MSDEKGKQEQPKHALQLLRERLEAAMRLDDGRLQVRADGDKTIIAFWPNRLTAFTQSLFMDKLSDAIGNNPPGVCQKDDFGRLEIPLAMSAEDMLQKLPTQGMSR